MEAVLWLGIGIVVVLASSIGAWARARRRQDLAAVAARAGLHYAQDDPFDCTRVAFALFRKGDGRGAENVMWRDADDGHTYRAFDYWWYDEHRDAQGRTTKSYERRSCAMALVGGSWPTITIEREGLLAKAAAALSGGDIDFESEEFNRTFVVRCDDRRFATALLDAQLLELLLSTKGVASFELKGRWLLVWTDTVKPHLMPGLLRLAERFVERIPNVVWELYPSPFVDGDGRPLPPGDDPVAQAAAELALGARRHDGEDDDPFAVLARSPFLPPEDADAEPEVLYDLDGKPLPHVEEDPWGDGRPLAQP